MARAPANVEDFLEAMRRHLPRFVSDYVQGGAGDELCMARNREDLDALTLYPRVLRDTTTLDTGVEVFGSCWRRPFAIAPTGLNGLVRPGGDVSLAVSAAAEGIPFTLSTASNVRLEAIRAAVPEGEQWMQLYVMQDRRIASQLIARAAGCGYRALVLTVDVPVSGLRLRDVRNGFGLPLRMTPRLLMDLLAHPRWTLGMARSGTPAFPNLTANPDGGGLDGGGLDGGGAASSLAPQAQAALLAREMDRTLDWRCIDWLRSLWTGPLLLKGILHPDDALRAVDCGIDGLIVSNHGGRQLEAAPSAIGALKGVVNTVPAGFPVFMDSGIRSGTDVAKALALGARAVFVGRPALYGLAVGGVSGIRAVLRLLGDDLERNMALLGVRCIGEFGAVRHDHRHWSSGATGDGNAEPVLEGGHMKQPAHISDARPPERAVLCRPALHEVLDPRSVP